MRPAWITPREEPETIEFHREVPLWELGEIAEEITDADYRKGICYSRSLGTRFGVKLPEALSQTVGIRPEGCRGCDEHATHWMPDTDPPETTP